MVFATGRRAKSWRNRLAPLVQCPVVMMTRNEELKIDRMMRELQSDMADLVAAGEMTAEEANEWANHKADQWAQGLS